MQKIYFNLNKLIFFLPLFLFSCSLNYSNNENAESMSPEFVFHNVEFVRAEDNKVKILFSADKIEQYSGVDAMYGTNISFSTFDETETKTMQGHCGLFSANNETKIFQLFSGITIHDYEKKADLSAQNLLWNGNTENLIGTTDDTVIIKTDNLTIHGTGFTANGKDVSFSLQKNVFGTITDTDKKDITSDGDSINEN